MIGTVESNFCNAECVRARLHVIW